MNNSSEPILGLKPIVFHYKTDKQNTQQFGLIAEEVAKVDPNLVVRDEKGEISTVRYEAVNAMLLNEVLKEHQKVEAQTRKLQEYEGRLTKQEQTALEQQKQYQTTVAQQQKQIEALTATIQKVSEKLELTKAAPQLATNP